MNSAKKFLFGFSMLILILAGCNTDQGAQNNDNPNNNDFQNVSFGPNHNNQNEGTENLPDIPLFDGNPNEGNIHQYQFRKEFRYQDGNWEEIHPDNRNQNRYQVPSDTEPNAGNTPEEGNNNVAEGDNQTPENGQATVNASEVVKEVVRLTNEERKKNGLSALKMDPELNNAAQKKSADMASNGYFSHNSPTYGSPFDMLKQFGIEYSVAAENIAAGQDTAQAVVDGWMNSEGHRKNILNKSVTHIGVGMAEGGAQGPYWTQLFIAK
ncbi:CAP domain-containing protein [Oceanobacillus senegalensis]|uniref:CAP domain-containing protein n=1 Tax=Oceanobacillus senegalensis TaxID=1936063 RepID=UPI001FE94FCA|nr:CAP domain-containing protein [Oceanobacillus senegalensis]